MRGTNSQGFNDRLTRGAWATALLVALALALPLAAAADEQFLRIELRPTDYQASEYYLDNVVHADISGRTPEKGTIEVIATESDLPMLWLLGEVSIVERSRPFREVQAERHDRGIDSPEMTYKDYSQVLAWMDARVAQNPAIAQKVNLTQLLGTPQTWDGRDMYALKISDNVAQDEDEVVILFDGLHHARELNTIEMVLDIGNNLLELYGAKPLPTAIIDQFEIWLVPVVNPDGLEYVWSNNNMWRKNRRNNGGGVFGVDPNRNYPFLWGACGSTSGVPSSETYRGPSPASEPEVQTMMALGESIRPTIYLSYHSFGRDVLPPYLCANLAEAPVVDAFRDLYRNRMGFNWRPASASGESFEWFYNQISSIGFLTEVGTAFQPPFSETLTELKRVRPGMITLLELLGSGPLVQGNVTDSVTGLPVEADVSTTTVNFTEGERRACEPDYGRYSWFLQTGAQTLTFSAPGYQSKAVPTVVPANGQTIDVELDPIP